MSTQIHRYKEKMYLILKLNFYFCSDNDEYSSNYSEDLHNDNYNTNFDFIYKYK